MDCAQWLTIIGGAFEIAGFGTVAYQLARLQREEFGTPAWVLKATTFLRRVFRRQKHVTQTVSAGGAVAGGGTVTGRGEVVPGADATLDERVAAMEARLVSMRTELDARDDELDDKIAETDTRLTQLRTEFDQRHQEQEERRRSRLRESLVWQAVGTGLFVVGAVLSVIGNTI